jgi:hypothetical protein
MKSNGKEISYIRVKKNGKSYRVYINDLKAIIMRPRKLKRPPVPPFDDPSDGESTELNSQSMPVEQASGESPTTTPRVCA